MYSNTPGLSAPSHNIPGVSSNSSSKLLPPGFHSTGPPSTMSPAINSSSNQLPPPRNRLKIRLGPQNIAPPFYLMSPQQQQMGVTMDEGNSLVSSHFSGDQFNSQAVTGWNNLIQHENLETSYHKFCGSYRRIQTEISGFLTGIAADVNLPASEDGGSLRSLIDRPPINRTIVPLQPSHSEVAFRLHTGRLPPKYMDLFTAVSHPLNATGSGNTMAQDDAESGNDMAGAVAVRNGKPRRKGRKDVLRDIPSASVMPSMYNTDNATGLPHVSSASAMFSLGPGKNSMSGLISSNRPVSTPLQAGVAPSMTSSIVASIHSATTIQEVSKKSRRSNEDDERRKKKKKEKKRKRDKD